jgi:hypothetical protein
MGERETGLEGWVEIRRENGRCHEMLGERDQRRTRFRIGRLGKKEPREKGRSD